MTEITIPKIRITRPTEEELNDLGIYSWGVWTCGVSRFDWEYTSQEACYFFEGDVTVETAQGNVDIKAGDFVVFQKGLKCVWDVKKPIRKVYNFS